MFFMAVSSFDPIRDVVLQPYLDMEPATKEEMFRFNRQVTL
jgi:hypothetical protein